MSNHLYDGVFAPYADSTKTFLYTADRDTSFAEFMNSAKLMSLSAAVSYTHLTLPTILLV